MLQVVQNYNTGKLKLEEVPSPICRKGRLIVRARYSLVSSGTERMKVTQARMNLLQMARARPDKVKQVMQSVKQVGVIETVKKVQERLDALTPLGYSLAGIVEEVGDGIDNFSPGDRVVCAGEGMACHAEFVSVPKNLCAHVPDNVDLKDAAFATVGAIAMNGVRQAGVTLGDSVLVVGLGLVGLLAVQLLKAAGCKVIGVDIEPAKVASALQCGADFAFRRDEDGLEESISRVTDCLGPDVIYVAASTKSTDPMTLAGRVARDRGKVIIVGMVSVEADWETYYRKELSVIMSRSYGPGRYDQNYEEKGVDYPAGYVRWTEGRNLVEFLRQIGAGRVSPRTLKPMLFPFAEAPAAYQQLHEAPGKHAAGLLFEYTSDAPMRRTVSLVSDSHPAQRKLSNSRIGVGIIGAGNFATGTIIPALKQTKGIDLINICSAGGLSAVSAGNRHGFLSCTSNYEELLADERIDAVFIITRHNLHSRLAAQAALAGKHVFVEKPLALTEEQLEEVCKAHQASGKIIMPGFNRRFSPLATAMRNHFAKRQSPIEVVCRVNAGALGKDSWYQDPDEGGWRIISEGCHFIDLIHYLCGSYTREAFASKIEGSVQGFQNDNCIATLMLEDGSLGTIIYVANGDPSYEKERIETFGQGRAAVIENWRKASLISGGKSQKVLPGNTGKGHSVEIAAFVEAIQSGTKAPLPFADAVACTLTSFACVSSMLTRQKVACASIEV
jgi:polar amino acid transport system substrate-binding protein